MKNFKMLMYVAAMLCILMCAGNALAGIKAGAITLSPSGGAYIFDDNKEIINDGRFYNLGLGYNFTQNLAAELSFGLIHTDAEDCNCEDIDVYGFLPRLEVLYHFMPDKVFVPYIAVGGGYLSYEYENDNVKKKVDKSAVADYGLGAKLFLTDNLALRGDARHIYDFENESNDFAVTLGLVYQFGGEEKKKAPEPCKDSDKDGVCDDKDKCLNTPAGTPVDSTGCPRVAETKMEKKTEPSKPIVTDDKKLPPTPPPPVKKVEPVKEERVEVTVLFDFDKIIIKPMYHDQLKKVADFMKANPTAVATIEGHTDNVGSDKYNLNLSRKRSQSVKNYIVKKFGVDPNRFTVSWYGKSKPAADNKTEEGRKLNRRAITISIKK